MVWGRPSAAPAPLGHRRAALCARRDLQVAHLNNASETAAGRLHEWLLCRRPPSARPGPARRAASGPYQTLSYLSNFISDAHPWGERGGFWAALACARGARSAGARTMGSTAANRGSSGNSSDQCCTTDVNEAACFVCGGGLMLHHDGSRSSSVTAHCALIRLILYSCLRQNYGY
jgi:hypothetical protein